MRILRTASGIASRCGSSAPLRAAAAAAMALATTWLMVWLWSWAVVATDPAPCFLAVIVSLVSVIVSLVTMGVMSDPPNRWTMETMTGFAPFVMWRAVTSDDRVTVWKLLLWPTLVPAEVLVCLWLAIGWLGRLLDVDLSKR